MAWLALRSQLVKAIFTITLNTGPLEKSDSLILMVLLVFFVLGAWSIKKGYEMQFLEEYNRWVGGNTKLLNYSKGLKNSKGIKPYLRDGYKIAPRYRFCFSEEVMVKFFR